MDNFFGEANYDQLLERAILACGFQDLSCFDSYLPHIKLPELEADK